MENIVEVDAAGAALDSSWLPVVVPVLLLPGVSQQPGHKLPPGQRGLTGSWMEELSGGWRLPDYQATRLPDYQNTRIPDYQTTRLPEYQTTRLPDYQTTRLPEYQTTIPPEYQTVRGMDRLPGDWRC